MTHYFKTIMLLSLACLTAGSTFAEDEETPLAKEMSAMNAAYRSLSKAFRSGPNPDQRAEYIAQVETILKHAKASVELVPALADTLAPEQKNSMRADYTAAMQKSIQTLEQLLAALEAQDYAAATERLVQLKKQKSAGHQRFQED
jgi:hypothetical protein